MTSVASAPYITQGMTAEGKEMAKYINDGDVRAMLQTIARAEGMEGKKDGGYSLGFGYREITSFSSHPYAGSELTPEGKSSASGAYQFMGHTWAGLNKELGLKDFTAISQDVAAIKLLKRRGVLEEVASGNVTSSTLDKLAPEWASINKGGTGYYAGQATKTGEQGNMLTYFKQQQAKQNQIQLPEGQVPATGVLNYNPTTT